MYPSRPPTPRSSLFRCFELVYVVGDESDLIRLRTCFRDERVYVFRCPVDVQGAQLLLRSYSARINKVGGEAGIFVEGYLSPFHSL